MKMENHKDEELRDWLNMSRELLEQICKLLTIPDQIRFSSVGKHWLSANTSKKAHHWIPSAPWLISKDYTDAQFQVISNMDKQAYNIYKPFKTLLGASIVGSCKGWLVLRSSLKLFILNLFSKLHLDLPSLGTVSCLLCSKNDSCLYYHLPLAFAIATCPNMNPTSVALITYNGYLRWCKVGDTTWKCDHTSDDFYGNVAFHNDKLYAVDGDGEKVNIFKYDEGVLVQVGSVKSTKPIKQLLGPIDKRVYLVECGGKVLVVRRITDDTKIYRPTMNFIISLVEENSSKPGLVQVQSLGDHILFVANTSIECLDAKYCPVFQPGCVYFTCYSETGLIPVVREFSVANGTILVSTCTPPLSPQMQSPVWVLPKFPFDCDCEECTSAMWITPEDMWNRLVEHKASLV